jgi:hypothetical protein
MDGLCTAPIGRVNCFPFRDWANSGPLGSTSPSTLGPRLDPATPQDCLQSSPTPALPVVLRWSDATMCETCTGLAVATTNSWGNMPVVIQKVLSLP